MTILLCKAFKQNKQCCDLTHCSVTRKRACRTLSVKRGGTREGCLAGKRALVKGALGTMRAVLRMASFACHSQLEHGPIPPEERLAI